MTEELDHLTPFGSEENRCLQRQLLLKTVNASDMILPWGADENSFLKAFDLTPPSTYNRLIHFKHFVYVKTSGKKFVKYWPKEVLCMMKELQDSILAPPFFKKVVKFALGMKDKNFTAAEELLPLETQLKQIETDFRTLVLEMNDLIITSEIEGTLMEGLLDKLVKLSQLDVTKVMLCKMPEAVNLVHYLTEIQGLKDKAGQLKSVILTAKEVMNKFESLLIVGKFEQEDEKRRAMFKALKKGNLALVRAAESRPHLFLTMCQEPIAVYLKFDQLVKLDSEMRETHQNQMEYVSLWAANNGFFL